jgi:hypothetical protein
MTAGYAQASPAARGRVVADVAERLGTYASGEGGRAPFRARVVIDAVSAVAERPAGGRGPCGPAGPAARGRR